MIAYGWDFDEAIAAIYVRTYDRYLLYIASLYESGRNKAIYMLLLLLLLVE